VDVAANIGRQRVSAKGVKQREWSAPVVFLGTPAGDVLGLANRPPSPAASPPAGLRARRHTVSRETLDRHKDLEEGGSPP
jgi:hypothetical protein